MDKLIEPKICEDCTNEFPEDAGRPWKYEPSIWLCDDCSAQRMDEDYLDD